MITLLRRFRSVLDGRDNIRAHVWQSLANYVQTIGGLGLSIALARMLSPEIFGKFAMISATLAVLMIPFSFSSGQLLVADRGRTDRLFEQVMGLTVVIVVAKSAVLGLFVAVMCGVYRDYELAVVSILVGVPLALGDWISTLRLDLEGRGYFRQNFTAQLCQISVNAVVSVGLILAGFGIYGLAAGGFAALLPQIVVYLKASRRQTFRFSLAAKDLGMQFGPGLWLWLNQTSEGLLSRVDKLFLGKAGGDIELGYYNRAFNFAPISQLALNSLMANATVVGLARLSTQSQQTRLFLKTSALVVAGAVLNWAIWWCFSDPLVVWIFGNQWDGAIPAFQAFSWLSLAYGLLYMPTTLLLAWKQFRTLAVCKCAGLLLLICMLILLEAYQLTSAASVAYCFLTVLSVMGLAISLASFRTVYLTKGSP